MDLLEKLGILADAAKYDASCASSGTEQRHSLGPARGIGSTEGMGICHAYAPDGRCISLLKILLTNACIYDCAVLHQPAVLRTCGGRGSRPRRSSTLTLGFYRRNCIEGLFLSSGIIRSADYTMEQVVRVARLLREDAWVPRLHPPQDDPRRRPGVAGGGRTVCRPAVHQCRAAEPGESAAARAGEGFRRHPPLDGADAAGDRGRAGEGSTALSRRPGRARR